MLQWAKWKVPYQYCFTSSIKLNCPHVWYYGWNNSKSLSWHFPTLDLFWLFLLSNSSIIWLIYSFLFNLPLESQYRTLLVDSSSLPPPFRNWSLLIFSSIMKTWNIGSSVRLNGVTLIVLQMYNTVFHFPTQICMSK